MTRSYVIRSDTHPFIGRIFDLSIASLWFEKAEEVKRFPDILFALMVNERLSLLVDRVESLNHAGDLLWPRRHKEVTTALPLSRYQWLQFIVDVFLMRIVSVTDCCLVLANEALELGKKPQECRLAQLESAGAARDVVDPLRRLVDAQADLRAERNLRVHEGVGMSLGRDDVMLRHLSMFEHLTGTSVATDVDGSQVHVAELYSEARDEIRGRFRRECIELSRRLNAFYSALHPHFEARFQEKYRSHPHDHPIYGSGRA